MVKHVEVFLVSKVKILSKYKFYNIYIYIYIYIIITKITKVSYILEFVIDFYLFLFILEV